MMTPPIGVPDLNMSAAAAPFLTTQPVAAPNLPIQKSGLFGGMFGGGGNAQMALMAAISGLMARRHPEVSQMMQGLMAHRMAQQQAEQTRQQQLQDQMAMFDYKSAHAPPDDFTQRVAALNQLKSGLGDTYAQNYANNGGGTVIQFTDPSTGQRYMMPNSAAQMPQIGAVVDDPRKQGGAGAAVPPPGF